MSHPSDRELTAFGQSALSPDTLLRVDDHLAICDACRTRAAALSGATTRFDAATAAIHRDLTTEPVRSPAARVRANIRWQYAAVAGAVAAAVAMAVTVKRDTASASPSASSAPARAAVDVPAASALTTEEQTIVDRALSSGDLPVAAAVASLRQQSGTLMGGPSRAANFAPVAPNGIVDHDRPTLSWSPLETHGQPVTYRVDLFDSAYRRVARGAWTGDTMWSPEQPLQPGRVYVWQVTARSGGREVTAPPPPQSEARFMVTDAKQHADLASLRRRADGSHVALAVLLAHAGVVDEAERELSLASAASPGSSAIKRLQESLKRQP